jgi:peptidoglycan hydrolase CwlO-like protein
MKRSYIMGLALIIFSSTACIAQNTPGCGTPPECYAKAAAMLNDATKQIGTLQDKVATLEQKIADQKVLIDVLKQVDIPRIQKEIENPAAQVGMYSCQKPIHFPIELKQAAQLQREADGRGWPRLAWCRP